MKIKENTIAQFFIDSGFIPPKTRNLSNFGFGYNSGVEEDMKLDSYDGIPDSILDMTKNIADGSEHPALSICSDFYMFNDPGTRTNPDLRTPLSNLANQTNVEYHKKDLSQIESASDAHFESLEQPAASFPRHERITSQMEPSVIPFTKNKDQIPTVLQQPTMIENIEYPKGTRIFVESSSINDNLYEDPEAKLCPICDNPYVGDVCSCCKEATPSKNAIRVQESDEDIGDVSEFEKPTYWTDKIFEILQKRGIKYTINPETGLIDVRGSVDLSYCRLESLGEIGFGNVFGNFNCSNNQLTTLKGAPKSVDGYFYCHANHLSTLTEAPLYVGEAFCCFRNRLITLEGSPQEVGRDFDCSNNFLTSLEGSPQKVGGSFFCQNNPKLPYKEINKLIRSHQVKGKVSYTKYRREG